MTDIDKKRIIGLAVIYTIAAVGTTLVTWILVCSALGCAP